MASNGGAEREVVGTPSVPPTDAEIVAYVVEFYSRDMAESVSAALRSTDGFADHVRRSFTREMETVRKNVSHGF